MILERLCSLKKIIIQKFKKSKIILKILNNIKLQIKYVYFIDSVQ